MAGLCYYFLPELKKHLMAYIMNMSSMEAILPLPYKAVYAGTKNFVYAFSLALCEELRRSGLTVSVVCPGPVLTNPDGLQRIEAHGRRARLLLSMPEDVARVAISKMLKGKQVIIPGAATLVIAHLQEFQLGIRPAGPDLLHGGPALVRVSAQQDDGGAFVGHEPCCFEPKAGSGASNDAGLSLHKIATTHTA